MAARLPPLNPLRTFEAAARLGSMKRAAEELHVTHGAVSHQVRTLEDALGLKLVLRRGYVLELTPAGRSLLPATSTALDSIRAAIERIGGQRAEGELTISCVAAFLSYWLIPKLPGFLEHFPDVRLIVIPTNDPVRHQAPGPEIMIRYGTGRWPDLWVRHLSHVELFPVLSPVLQESRPLKSVKDLAQHPLLHASTRLEWNNWLTVHNALEVADAQHHIFADALLALHAAVSGVGIALGDQITTSDLLESRAVVAPLGLSARAVHDFHVACRSEEMALPQVRAFLDWIFDTYRSFGI